MMNKKELIKDAVLYLIILFLVLWGGLLALGIGIDFDTYVNLSGGDGVLGGAIVKSIQDNGILGMYFNERFGAPGSGTLIDFPCIDIMMGSIIWVISLFASSTPRILYLFYLISFILDSVSLALLLRKLRIQRWITLVVCVAFSFVPYHFLRGMMHSSLLNYYSFVIALYLSLCVLGYFENEKKWKIVLLSMVLGFSYGYYYAFGLIMMAVAFIIRFCKMPKIKEAMSYIWIPITTLLFIALALSPQIVFHVINGKNGFAGGRLPIEQEIYGLKIFQLFLPPSYSRLYVIFPKLGTLYNAYVNSAPLVNENSSASLGFFALVGFLGLCFSFIYSFATKKADKSPEWELIDYLSLTTLVFVLTATIGGFGELFNTFVTAQIRCYNRCSIFIAGLSLVFLALMLNKIKIRIMAIRIVTAVVLVYISFMDTALFTPSSWQLTIAQTQECYETYFSNVEEALGENAMVYQLPYIDFPEAVGAYDYKHFVGYLFTDTIRWSYGGVKGRDYEAKDLLIGDGDSYEFIKKLQDSGFSAVYIDRAGYNDNGEKVLAFYNKLECTPIVSNDDMLYLYDIRGINVSQAQLQKGYSFISMWNDIYNMNLSEDEIGYVAKKLDEQNVEAYTLLWDGVEPYFVEYSDEEYVNFLYSAVLQRECADEEQDSWVNQLENGMDRKSVFDAFFNSDEFRLKNGYLNAG